MFGSGQWTIWEGYAAAKLFKAGFRSNNIDPNARHCMASAVAGFMRTFGIDEPMGCYDDIEAADAFVLWGSNMAEMHPILWTRVTDRRLSRAARPGRRALDLRAPLASTSPTSAWCSRRRPISRSSTPSPTTSSRPAASTRTSSTKHTVFKRGQTDIGYGLRPEHPLQKTATGAAKAGRLQADHQLRRVREVRLRLHAREGRRDVRRAGRTGSRRWPSSTPTRRPR